MAICLQYCDFLLVLLLLCDYKFSHMNIMHNVVAPNTLQIISRNKLLYLYKPNCIDLYIFAAPTFNIFVNDHAHVKNMKLCLGR